MIDKSTIFEIHRLRNEGLTNRQIAVRLNVSRPSVKKYLQKPDMLFKGKKAKGSKLAPFRELIDQFLEKEPTVKAPVVLQRISEKGFDGQITIVRDYLRLKRGQVKKRKAFIRFESPAGKQMQLDWGHFGTLSYGNTKRKLYCLSVVECYSRMLYLEFSHSQKQESLHQILLNAFRYFGGAPEQVVVDNMLTAVTERVGSVIHFNDAFLDFLRPFKIVPYACNVSAPYEKGKVEKSISYIRMNFWPLRTFTDIYDVQPQADNWRDTVANIRMHETTGQRPKDRFENVKLKPLPDFLPDCSEISNPKVFKDFAIKFDGNTYTTPPWAIGKRVAVKANKKEVAIFYKNKKLAVHARSYERKKRVELPTHQEQVKKIQNKLWKDQQIASFITLAPEAETYFKALATARQPLKKNIAKLMALKDEYGAPSLIYAIKRALQFKAYGADYVENILYQEMTPHKKHPPVRLKNDALNRIRLSEPMLADYDAFILKRRRNDN